MKKHLLWLAAGTIALSACTSTEVLDESSIQSNAIGFENVIKKPTRAISGDIDLDKFDTFSVYGYYTKPGLEAHAIQVFNGDIVSKNTTTTTTTPEEGGEPVETTKTSWKYDHTRYWVPEATYYFYAYSCADVAFDPDASPKLGSADMDVTSTDDDPDQRSLKINEYICNSTHQHDLICAFKEGVTGKANGNTAVQLTFKHALCKVSAEFVNDFPAGYEITVSDVKIKNFYDKANFDIRNNTWSGQERSTENQNLEMAMEGENNTAISTEDDENAEKVSTKSVFLLPVVYGDANVSIEFKLSVKQGEDEFLNRSIKGTWKPEWQPGFAYKYTIHITGSTAKLEPIVFEAKQNIDDVENWNGNITENMTFSTI